MIEKKTVLAIGAHADDVEFNMAGTLCLLKEVGFELHIMTLAHCDLDSNELSRQEMARIRRQEAERSAEVIGGVYHPSMVPDLMVFYEDGLLRKVASVIREVRPTIVLLPSLEDYMEDHTNTARLAVTACFSRGMRNYLTDPPRDPVDHDVFLYHAQPHLNRDQMGNFIVPEIFVDIERVMETKLAMLRCYESQLAWLQETQGMDDFLEAMRSTCSELAEKSGIPALSFAEGFRKHSHVGFSAKDDDPLTDVLGARVTILDGEAKR